MLCGRKKQFIEWFILTRYGWFKMLSIIQNQKLIRFSSLEKRDQSFIIHHFRTFPVHNWTTLVLYSCSWFQTPLSDLCYSCLTPWAPSCPALGGAACPAVPPALCFQHETIVAFAQSASVRCYCCHIWAAGTFTLAERDGHGAHWEELWLHTTCKSAEHKALYSYSKFYFPLV